MFQSVVAKGAENIRDLDIDIHTSASGERTIGIGIEGFGEVTIP